MAFIKNRKKKKILRAIDRIRISRGLSYSSALHFCIIIGVSPFAPETYLNNDHRKKVRKFRISKQMQPSEVLRFSKDRINLKKKIRCYQGIRHLQSLPVHGQNTKNNARIAKKKRKK